MPKMKSPGPQDEDFENPRGRKGNYRRRLHPLADMALFEMRGI